MSRRQQHYDPIIQAPDAAPPPIELPPLRGIVPELPGLYLYAPDVVANIRRMAEAYHDFDTRAALMEVASQIEGVLWPDEPKPIEPTWCPERYEDALQCQDVAGHVGAHCYVGTDGQVVHWGTPPPEPPPVVTVAVPVLTNPEVARVEVFPNEDGTYWYARAVNDGGFLLTALGVVQGISRDQVETDAAARWPGAPVYEVPDAMGDSLWDEQAATFGWNGRRRPSPRRLFANT